MPSVKTLKIALDAGHGPQTPGKRTPDGSMREFYFNSAVARYAAELLAEYEGVETFFTHEENRDVPLFERTQKANARGADVFISIHANAAGSGWNDAQGIETYTHTTRTAASVKLAEAVQRRLIEITGRPNRGVKAANFLVLRETAMPAVLIEAGFMTNREEAELLKSDSYRRKVAQAAADALVQVYGLMKRKVEQLSPAPLPTGEEVIIYVNEQMILGGKIIDGRTYVPLRELAEVLGAELSWTQATRTAKMTTD